MGKKSAYLYDDQPIVIDRSLATIIGLNEAIVLQQLNYWINKNRDNKRNFYDGKYWAYNTYKKWREENFPFWGINTIRRTFSSLEKKKIVVTGNYNKAGFDKTKWYSIDYKALNRLVGKRCAQNGQTDSPKWANGSAQNRQTNTRDYTETTSEINNKDINSSTSVEPPIPYKEIISYLNKKTGKAYKAVAKANQRFIKARWNEGYKLDDFKTVIDNKCFDWQGDKNMSKYLRPETLFGTKFDSYLNENKGQPSQSEKDEHQYSFEELEAKDLTPEQLKELDDLPF